MQGLDETNRRILEKLVENGRITYIDIAEELGLSESTVRKRINKLKKDQVISRFTITINPEKIGKNIISFITVNLKSQSNIKKLTDSIIDLSDIAEIFYMSGKCGLLIKVQVSSLSKLNELIEKIREKSEINTIESCIVLRILKFRGKKLNI